MGLRKEQSEEMGNVNRLLKLQPAYIILFTHYRTPNKLDYKKSVFLQVHVGIYVHGRGRKRMKEARN